MVPNTPQENPVGTTPTESPREARNLEDVGEANRNVLAGERDFKDAREKLQRELDNDMPHVKPLLKDTTRFWVEQLFDKLLSPLDAAYNKYSEAVAIIEKSELSQDYKTTQLRLAYAEYKKELDLSVDNAQAYMTSLKQGHPDLEIESTAALAKDVNQYLTLMTYKGGALQEIFAGFINAPKLSTDGKDKKVLDEAFLKRDETSSNLAFYVLAQAKIGTREEYITYFIGAHPDKAIDFLEKGNRYGCFSANDIRNYFTTISSDQAQSETVKKTAQDKLAKWDSEEKTYTEYYEVQKKATEQTIKSFSVPDAKGGAAKMLTAAGIGKFLAIGCALATGLSNIIANKNNLLHDKAAFFKNPYLLGSIGALFALYQNSKGQSLADFFMPKAERDKLKREEDGRKLVEAQDRYYGWNDKVLGGEMGDAMGEYIASIKAKGVPVEMGISIDEFSEACKKVDEKNGNTKATEAFTKLKEGKTDQDIRQELRTFCVSFDELGISDGKNYKTVMEEIKTQSK